MDLHGMPLEQPSPAVPAGSRSPPGTPGVNRHPAAFPGAGPGPPPRSRRCSAGRDRPGSAGSAAAGIGAGSGPGPGSPGRADARLGAAPAVPRRGPGLAPARGAALPGQARGGQGRGHLQDGPVPPGPLVLLHPAELGAGFRAPHCHDPPPSGVVPPEQTQRWGLFPHGLQRHHPLPAAEADRAVPADAAALRAVRQHHHLRHGRQHPPGGRLRQPPAHLQRVPAPPVRQGQPHHQEPQTRDPDRLLRAALLLRRVFGALHVVHPVLPDPLHLLQRLLHAGGAARPDAPGCAAPGGAQQPLLLVPGDRGPDLHPVHLHLLRHAGAGAAAAAQGAGAGQQRALPAALLPPGAAPHPRLGGLPLERRHPPQKIPRRHLRPRALGLLQPAPPGRCQRLSSAVWAEGGGRGENNNNNNNNNNGSGFSNVDLLRWE